MEPLVFNFFVLLHFSALIFSLMQHQWSHQSFGRDILSSLPLKTVLWHFKTSFARYYVFLKLLSNTSTNTWIYKRVFGGGGGSLFDCLFVFLGKEQEKNETLLFGSTVPTKKSAGSFKPTQPVRSIICYKLTFPFKKITSSLILQMHWTHIPRM